MHMRSEFPPLCGRDHLSFRSYYFPVKVSTRTGKPLSFSVLQAAFNKCCNFLVRLNDKGYSNVCSGYIHINNNALSENMPTAYSNTVILKSSITVW